MKSSTGWVTFISDSYKWSSHRYKVSVNSYTNDNSSLTNLKNFQKKKKKWLIANNFLLNITNNEIVHSKSQKTVWLNGKIYIILILWDIWTSKFLSAYLNDGRAVTSKLYTMLKENLLNLCFIPFMNPIFTTFLLFELKFGESIVHISDKKNWGLFLRIRNGHLSESKIIHFFSA